MGRAIALGVSAATATGLLPAEALAQTPKRGGSVKFGLAQGATTDSADPATFNHAGTLVPLWGTLANSLTEVDAKGNITPDLAESFESTNKASSWVFKLRRGVTFHNGKDLTADDVVASFRHHMGPNTKSGAKSLLSGVQDVKADGKSTVIFTLDTGNADFPYLASDYHLPIMPANADGTADWQSNVRTGPFSFVSWQPGVRSKFKRNPNYFEPGKPYFDEVEFIVITDPAARMAALTTGEVDWIARAELKTVSLLKRHPQINVIDVAGYLHHMYVMDTTVAPFNNPDVRNAFKLAINREEIAQKVFLGHGQLANDNPIAPAVKFGVDPKPRHSYDPQKAKALLKKAGMDNVKVDLYASDRSFVGAVDASVLFQQSAKAAGIDINVIRESGEAWGTNVWNKKPFYTDYWAGRPTVDWMLSTVYAKSSPWNLTRWTHARFNDLLAQARAETDEKTRAGMYAELQQIIHDDGGAIVFFFSNYVEAASKKLAHGVLANNLESDGAKMAKRWWFA
ncbi:hypothetical protein CQ10_29870 [Bradyrhizobium valentinum]|nr:hypothetical protein CQ10_29870 [Bradyrhizobium valentinum]